MTSGRARILKNDKAADAAFLQQKKAVSLQLINIIEDPVRKTVVLTGFSGDLLG